MLPFRKTANYDYVKRVDGVLQTVKTKKGTAYVLSVPLAPSKADRIALKITRELMDEARKNGHQINLADEKSVRLIRSKVAEAIKVQNPSLAESALAKRSTVATKRAISNYNALKGQIGLKTGVMTFVFSEACCVYRFFDGQMDDGTFAMETAKNLGGAFLTGAATHVAVALGATPTGWVVLGVGIGVYTVYDFAFVRLQQAFEDPLITFDDILGQLPTDIQRRKNAMTLDGFDTILEYQGYPKVLDYSGEDTVLDYRGKTNSFDHQPVRKSVLDY